MKTTIKLILLLLLFVSCDSTKNKNVENISITPTLLFSDLDMELPGDFVVVDSMILIEKVRSADNFINVYDLKTLQFKTSFCNKGKAANELIQCLIIIESDSTFMAYDLNNKGIIYSLKDFSILDIRNDLGFGYDQREKINADSYVVINCNNDDNLFTYYTKSGKQSFGKLPLEGDFKNKSEMNRGNILFTSNDSTLHFFSDFLPYYAKYKMKNNQFDLIDEKFHTKYSISKDKNGRAVIECDEIKMKLLSFTKNYIVELRRSPEDQLAYENSKQSSNKVSNWPRHLYLYDYDLNLVKIVNIGVNTLRFTAESLESDVVYLIHSEEGLYNISKVEL